MRALFLHNVLLSCHTFLLLLLGVCSTAHAQIDPATPDSLYRISADPLLNGDGDIVRVGNDVYLANAAHNVVLKIDGATGVTSVFAGAADKPSGFANGVGPDARFSFPSCITADGEGNLYVGDMGKYLIRKVTTAATVTIPAAEVTVLKAYGKAYGSSWHHHW